MVKSMTIKGFLPEQWSGASEHKIHETTLYFLPSVFKTGIPRLLEYSYSLLVVSYCFLAYQLFTRFPGMHEMQF